MEGWILFLLRCRTPDAHGKSSEWQVQHFSCQLEICRCIKMDESDFPKSIWSYFGYVHNGRCKSGFKWCLWIIIIFSQWWCNGGAFKCVYYHQRLRGKELQEIYILSARHFSIVFFLLVIDICAVNGNNFLLFSILPVHASSSDLHTMSFGFVVINKRAIFVQKEFTFV